MTACLEFLHTGDVECLNGLQLKYANKTYSYRYCNMQIRYYSTLDILSWLSMVIRACLVALDWNYNVDTEAVSENCRLSWIRFCFNTETVSVLVVLTYSFQVDRTGSRCSVVPVKVAKDSSWQDAIFNLCIDSLETGQMPNPQVVIGLIAF